MDSVDYCTLVCMKTWKGKKLKKKIFSTKCILIFWGQNKTLKRQLSEYFSFVECRESVYSTVHCTVLLYIVMICKVAFCTILIMRIFTYTVHGKNTGILFSSLTKATPHICPGLNSPRALYHPTLNWYWTPPACWLWIPGIKASIQPPI